MRARKRQRVEILSRVARAELKAAELMGVEYRQAKRLWGRRRIGMFSHTARSRRWNFIARSTADLRRRSGAAVVAGPRRSAALARRAATWSHGLNSTASHLTPRGHFYLRQTGDIST
jgi:hypothetical protein